MTPCIITGGRDYAFTPEDIAWLDQLYAHYRFTLVIEGGCRRKDYRGDDLPTADYCGYMWALRVGIQTATMAANWSKHGKAAGPIRNEAMAKLGEAIGAIVIAFPGGRGTADMISRAGERGLNVERK